MLVTQGDPAGIGPELLLGLLEGRGDPVGYRGLLVVERSALEAVAASVRGGEETLAGLRWVDSAEEAPDEGWAALDPVAEPRAVTPGRSGVHDARGALAALDVGIAAAVAGTASAIVTAPLGKESIARHLDPAFRGHTDYLARASGLARYGRDYLMTFLAPGLQVALLTTHLPLAEAIRSIDEGLAVDALRLLHRHGGGRIALAAMNPHAGEGGLLGDEDARILSPAVARARGEGIEARGPEPADSVFARARRGEFDWVLALYHDQGLIAVKTAAPGRSVNWTLGLPYVRTSVDHGTAYDIAGRGRADGEPLREALRRAVELVRHGPAG